MNVICISTYHHYDIFGHCSQRQKILSIQRTKVKDGKLHYLLLFSSFCKVVFAVQAKPFSIWNLIKPGEGRVSWIAHKLDSAFSDDW